MTIQRTSSLHLEKYQASGSFDYLLSDNPACSGRFLSEECKLQPRDNRNMLRCKSEATRQRVETLKNKITARENSLFTKTTGKLQTGLMCRHKCNADTLHFITTGFEENIILSTTKSSESRKRKESSAKAKRCKIHAAEARRREPVSYFCLWEAHQLTTSMIH